MKEVEDRILQGFFVKVCSEFRALIRVLQERHRPSVVATSLKCQNKNEWAPSRAAFAVHVPQRREDGWESCFALSFIDSLFPH